MEKFNPLRESASLDCCILQQGPEKQEIIFLLSDHTSISDNDFKNDDDCIEQWNTFINGLLDVNFIPYYNLCFRPEYLRSLTKNYTNDSGHYLLFEFHSSIVISRQYDDEENLELDLQTLCALLCDNQNSRASSFPPQSIH